MYHATVATSRSLSFDPVAAAHDVWTEKGWGGAAIGMSAVASIMRAHQLFLAEANDALRQFDLTFARYEVLAWLAWNAECGQLSLTQIGERLQVTPATVTKVRSTGSRQTTWCAACRTPVTPGAPWPKSQRGAARRWPSATAELNQKVFFEAIPLSKVELEVAHQALGHHSGGGGGFLLQRPI